MSGPYRTTADTGEEPAPRELAYYPEPLEPGSYVAGRVILLCSLLGGGLAVIGIPQLSLPGMLILGAYLYVRWRRARSRPHAIFRVEHGVLRLTGPFVADVELALEKLVDVRLDTKTIQRVVELSARAVGDETETARVELVRRNDSIFLTRDYLSYIDSSEWAGRIRRFLRKHGWCPADEREADAAAQKPHRSSNRR